MKKINLLIALLICISTDLAFAQGRQITGTVLDETGVGLAGAGIGIQGTSSGTVTDVDGKFQLDLPEGNNTIVVQAVGYLPQTLTVTGNTVTVRMASASQELEGAVVTANAIRREKRSLGYSTTQVTGNELTAGGSTSPLNALVGKTAGANITTTSNSPGSSSRIVLRGGSSLTGNNQALIVVDGVPINNSNFSTNGNIGILSNQVDYGNRANDINPEDIESISVLKGPAATAQYGSLGSNGAIMITTKKGRMSKGPKKTDIEVSSSYELSNILKYPEFQNSYGQGIVKGVVDDRRENFSWGLPFDGQNRPWGQVIDGQQKVKPYSAMEDNVKDFFDVGQTWNNNVAINGGGENSMFRLSLGAINGKLIYPGKKYNRYTIGFNGNAKLSNKFYSSVGFNYIKTNSDLPASGQGGASILNNLYQQPRDIPITELANLDDKFNSMNYTDELGVDRYGYYGAYTTNPYYVLREYKNINKVDRIFGNYILGYQILDWLKLENRFALDMYSDRRYQSQPVFSSIAADESQDMLYAGNDPQTSLGMYSEDIYNIANFFNDLMLSATKDLTKDLSFTGLLGHNVTSYRTDNLFASTNEEGGISVPGYYNLSNSKGMPFNVNTVTQQRKVGLYGDFGLGYKNYLFANLTGRYDKSSTIKKGYFYYGANASVVFSEFFSSDLKRAWSYGKLRLSFGSVGNDAGPYLDRTYYNRTIANGNFGSTVFPLNGVPGFSYDNRLGNPNLQPEFTKEFEVGTEMGFWDNRATIDFSYYSKRSRNQLVTVFTAASSGGTTQTVNTGLVTNNGIELALRVTPIMLPSGFRWELFGTYTKNNNKVVDIYPGVNQIPIGGTTAAVITATVGRPYGTFYMVGYDRTPDGRIIIDTATNTGKVSDTSLLFGTYLPKFQASWGTSLSYKGFSLSLLFDMKQGGVFYSRTRDIMGFVGTSKETEDRTERVWANSVIEVGDQQYVTNTRPYDPYVLYTTSGLRAESDNLVDASYVKLREARLTYILPPRWFNKTFIGNASVSIYGNNLIIWTPAENKYVDPEVNSSGAGNAQGFDFTASPSLRNYGINVRLTF